jgi:hypothetical protein
MFRLFTFCAVLLMTTAASAQCNLFGCAGAIVVPRRTVQVAVIAQPVVAVAEVDCAEPVAKADCAQPVVLRSAGCATHALVATTRVRRVRIGRAFRIFHRQGRLLGRLGCLHH